MITKHSAAVAVLGVLMAAAAAFGQSDPPQIEEIRKSQASLEDVFLTLMEEEK